MHCAYFNVHLPPTLDGHFSNETRGLSTTPSTILVVANFENLIINGKKVGVFWNRIHNFEFRSLSLPPSIPPPLSLFPSLYISLLSFCVSLSILYLYISLAAIFDEMNAFSTYIVDNLKTIQLTYLTHLWGYAAAGFHKMVLRRKKSKLFLFRFYCVAWHERQETTIRRDICWKKKRSKERSLVRETRAEYRRKKVSTWKIEGEKKSLFLEYYLR